MLDKNYVPQTLDLPNYIVIFTPFEFTFITLIVLFALMCHGLWLGFVTSAFLLMLKRTYFGGSRWFEWTARLYQCCPIPSHRLPPSGSCLFRGSHGF